MYNVDDSRIRESAIIANAVNFIDKDEKFAFEGNGDARKPENGDRSGFDRLVGLKGHKLSGGQKQRVAIARAVLRDPNVYLFDEATSALDTESEKIVQNALDKLSKVKTTVNIAHRISTIKGCDKIFVIDGKRLAEEGTYEELISKKGVFWRINSDL
jgi:ATP-binding cassette subfamily B (MDR/TAP) protein 1